MIIYTLWLAILLSPYWLGPILVWATKRWSTRPVFEPFDPDRHGVPDDVATAFRATQGALAGTGVADLCYATGRSG